MSLKQLFPYRGDRTNIAMILGVTQPSLHKWWVRGYLPIRHALKLEQAFGIPAESMVDAELKFLLSNRPKKGKHMNISDPRAGTIIDHNAIYATWANVSKVDSLPDTYELLLSSQLLTSKTPDQLQPKAQLFLSNEGVNNLAKKIATVFK